jgi:transposase-like protein
MKKGPSESTRNPGNTTHRRRKYGEEFKLQALAMIRNCQSQRSVAETLVISENLIHFI